MGSITNINSGNYANNRSYTNQGRGNKPMELKELNWIAKARSYIGTKEIKGARHNPKIIEMLNSFGDFNGESKAWWANDEVPWCGVFVGHTLGECNRYVIKNWYRAKEWANANVMTKLDNPAYGAIAVLSRKGGGHVAFVVGKTENNRICLLGGNQSDEVNIKSFLPNHIMGYYWPSRCLDNQPIKSKPNSRRYDLPILNYTLSTKES